MIHSLALCQNLLDSDFSGSDANDAQREPSLSPSIVLESRPYHRCHSIKHCENCQQALLFFVCDETVFFRTRSTLRARSSISHDVALSEGHHLSSSSAIRDCALADAFRWGSTDEQAPCSGTARRHIAIHLQGWCSASRKMMARRFPRISLPMTKQGLKLPDIPRTVCES
jgi:hypothetical protein